MSKFVAALFVIASLSTIQTAHAILQPIGTFIPSLCGAPVEKTLEINASLPGLKEICLGKLSQLPTEVITLEFEDGASLSYEIKTSSESQKGRATLRYFTAKNMPKLSKKLRMGQDKIEAESIESPQRKKNQHVLEIKSAGLGLKAQVPLQIIFTTMSAPY